MHAFCEEVSVLKGYRTNFVKSCSAAHQNFTCSDHQLCLFGLVVHLWSARKSCARFFSNSVDSSSRRYFGHAFDVCIARLARVPRVQRIPQNALCRCTKSSALA